MLKNRFIKLNSLAISICIILFFIVTVNSYSYPIFFSCSENEKLEKFVPPDELEDLISAYLGESLRSKGTLDELCQGLEECLYGLRSLVSFIENLTDVNTELLKKEIERIENEKKKSISQTFKGAEQIALANKKIANFTYQCQSSNQKLATDKFIIGDKLVLFYPFLSNYSYIVGCTGKNKINCKQGMVDKAGIEKEIKIAVAMGVDPYAFLAIRTMENANKFAKLGLDPVAKLDVMGCSGRPATEHEADTLNSFGNLYKYKEQVIQNDPLSSSLKSILVHVENTPVKDGKSYLCRGINGYKDEIVAEPNSKSCCLQLNFSISGLNEREGALKGLDNALTHRYLNRNLNRKFRNQTDPAFRLQRFNGYTDLMGGIEPVAAFRAGVNFFKTPTYGYQAMDYILNTFLTNPWIRKTVEDAVNDMNTEFKSILCAGREPGSYVVEHDHYLELHKNAPRMEKIIEKLKAGESLNTRERTVLLTELKDWQVLPKLGKKFRLFVPTSKGLEKHYDNTDGLFESPKEFKYVATDLGVSALVEKGVSNDLAVKIMDTAKREQAYYKEFAKLFVEFEGFLEKKFGDLNAYLNPRSSDLNTVMSIIESKVNRKISKIEEKQLTDLFTKAQESGKNYEKYRSELERLKKDVRGQFKIYVEDEIEEPKSLKEYMEEVESFVELTDLQKEAMPHFLFSQQYKSEFNNPLFDENILQYYLEEIYPQRKTVGAASHYPWTQMSQEQARKYGQRLKKSLLAQ